MGPKQLQERTSIKMLIGSALEKARMNGPGCYSFQPMGSPPDLTHRPDESDRCQSVLMCCRPNCSAADDGCERHEMMRAKQSKRGPRIQRNTA